MLLLLLSSSLVLSCHANKNNQVHLQNALGASSRPRRTIIVGSSRQVAALIDTREIMPATRNVAAAFLPIRASSPSMVHHARRSEMRLRPVVPHANSNMIHSASHSSTALPMFGKPPQPSSPFQRHDQKYHRRLFIRSLAASDSVDDEEQQKGMDEAFASLESLSSEDWNAKSDNDNDNSEVSEHNLKNSRTDDTQAADSGKSTEEEVGIYLEMQAELEGTAAMAQQDEEMDETELLEIEDMMETEEDDDDAAEASTDLEEEFPWTSINPILRLRGPVASGYGRGGKKLGVPTANLPASLFQSALEDVTNGVYFGWAVIEDDISSTKKGRNTPIKAVVNVGYSPTFEGKENKEKIVEAHLITESSPMEKPESSSADNGGDDEQLLDNDTANEIEGDFYDETMRLQLIGYLRPEQKFDAFPLLIAQIHRDIGNAHWALDTMPFIFSKEDEFVKDGVDWVGSGGGDGAASWEFESW